VTVSTIKCLRSIMDIAAKMQYSPINRLRKTVLLTEMGPQPGLEVFRQVRHRIAIHQIQRLFSLLRAPPLARG